MRVAVVRLRFNGQKLPKQRLQQIPPIHGNLSIDRRLDRREQRWTPTAWLLSERLEALVPVMRDVRVVQMRGASFVLVGLEEILMRQQEMHFPQAWWCRVVELAALPALPASSTTN